MSREADREESKKVTARVIASTIYEAVYGSSPKHTTYTRTSGEPQNILVR